MKDFAKMPPWLAFLIGVGVFLAARQISELPGVLWGDSIAETLPWLGHAVIKTVLIIVALIGGLLVTRGKLGQHGYRMPDKWHVWSWLWPGLLIGGITSVTIILSPAEGMSLKRFGSGLAILLSLLYSSVSEELFCRGFIQSLMVHLRLRKVNLLLARVSTPALTSGLLFGAMHLSIYFGGADILTTVIIVASTIILGITAGHLFDKTESLIPAIVVHIGFNLGSFLGGMIANIALFIATGKLPAAGG